VVLGLYIQRFAAFLKTDEGSFWAEKAEAKKKLYSSLLAKEALDGLKEEGVRDLLGGLDSLGGEERSSLSGDLLKVYGLESIRELVKYLLYGDDPLEERYDRVARSMPEIGQRAISELAMYAAPRDFCLWDEATMQTLVFIGQSRMHGLSEKAFGEEISGLDYVACKVAMNHIKEQLRPYLQRKVDFVDAYLFSRFINEKVRVAPRGAGAASATD